MDPDSQKMVQFQQGDLKAYEELVEKYTHKIINLSYKYTCHAFEAEDVAQEVFLRVFKARKNYEPRCKFSTWLYRIAVNVNLNNLRSSKSRFSTSSFSPEESIEVPSSNEKPPPEAMEKKELQEEILRILESLPPQQKMAVILSKYEELSCIEISEIMDMSLPAVKSLLHRGMEKVKEKLLPYMQKGNLRERNQENLS